MIFFFVDAVSKLEEVLTLNPGKHQALWCLGNAYTTQAFLFPDADVAKGHFDKAVDYLQRAENEVNLQILWAFKKNICYCYKCS